jgi:hypothetical protein
MERYSEPQQSSSRELSPRHLPDHLRLLEWICLAPGQFVAYRERVGWEAIEEVGVWLASTLICLPVLVPTLARGLGIVPTSELVWCWLLGLGLILVWVVTGFLGAAWDSKMIGIWVGVIAGFFAGAFSIADLNPVMALAAGLVIAVALAVAFTVAWVVVVDVERGSGKRAEWVELANVERKEWVVVTSVAAGMAFGTAFSGILTVAATVTGSEMAGYSLMLIGILAFAGLYIVVKRHVIDVIKASLATGRPTWQGKAALAALALSTVALIWIYLLGGWQVLAPPG